MCYSTSYQSSLGPPILTTNEKSIMDLWVDGQKYFLGAAERPLSIRDDLPIFAETKTWLDCYFANGQSTIRELSLVPTGGEFCQNVWKTLCRIPYGQVITYDDTAREITALLDRGRMSVQAVGSATPHNPISVIIPCRRIVDRDDSLTGYTGGMNKKIRSLGLEGIDISKYSVPTKSTAPQSQ